jgi:hypothetical protein
MEILVKRYIDQGQDIDVIRGLLYEHYEHCRDGEKEFWSTFWSTMMGLCGKN